MGCVAASNLVACALAPTSYLWHCVTGAHQPCWIGRPRSGRRSGSNSVIGPDSEEINLTFSPLISTYHLNSRLKLNIFIFLFHHRSAHRVCSIITVSTIILNSYNTPLCFETDSQLGPYCLEIICFPINPCQLCVL
jgi:hypothetical protein